MSLANELPVPRAATFSAWLELTKPRIVSLVLFTGLPALLLAAHRFHRDDRARPVAA